MTKHFLECKYVNGGECGRWEQKRVRGSILWHRCDVSGTHTGGLAFFWTLVSIARRSLTVNAELRSKEKRFHCND